MGLSRYFTELTTVLYSTRVFPRIECCLFEQKAAGEDTEDDVGVRSQGSAPKLPLPTSCA